MNEETTKSITDKDIVNIKRLVEEMLVEFNKYPHISAIMHRLDKEDIHAISNVVLDFEKKNNIIDFMSRMILNYDNQLIINKFKNKDDVKEYFEENYEELKKKYMLK